MTALQPGRPDEVHNVAQFAGVPMLTLDPPDADQWLIERARAGVAGHVHYVNAYSIAQTMSSPELLHCFEDASANCADGRPIELLSRWFGSRSIPQNRGPAAFERIIDFGRGCGLRHFLLGSTPQTLAALERSLRARFPGVEIAGTESPPFRRLDPAEQAEQDRRIRACNPHIVWVGLGTPKQDLEAARLAGAGFLAVAVGAAFDFSAGTKREAPPWVRNVSMEWLYRLMSEPRRLWRRYLVGNAVFLAAVWQRR
jgi:N-acetylglucosaminyldiphosphoundecaprenol N-acetyl-beta-D-mannosaminyltransferase